MIAALPWAKLARVLVHMEHVASLETEEAYDARTKGGVAVTGRFLTGPEGQVLVVADDQSRPSLQSRRDRLQQRCDAIAAELESAEEEQP